VDFALHNHDPETAQGHLAVNVKSSTPVHDGIGAPCPLLALSGHGTRERRDGWGFLQTGDKKGAILIYVALRLVSGEGRRM
jgi:hypothetical protein